MIVHNFALETMRIQLASHFIRPSLAKGFNKGQPANPNQVKKHPNSTQFHLE